MTDDKKISDEELENQIRQGKEMKQIAYDFGYGYPSRTLSERAKDLGYRNNHRFTIQDWGGATISLDSDTIEQASKLSGVEPEEVDGSEKLFKSNRVVAEPNSFELRQGDVVLRFHEDAWRRVEDTGDAE
jgi:hypothetical protein